MTEQEKLKIKNKTINILQEIVKSGYVPKRCQQSYDYVTKLGLPAYCLANCFSHACFNLTNDMFDKYSFDEDMKKSINHFYEFPFDSNECIEGRMINLIKEVGLKITLTKPSAILKENEWKVALYFSKEGLFKDFHLLLREKDNTWTSKEGATNKFYTINDLPKKYKSYWFKYKLYNVYKIENPYAQISQEREK